ncbi:MAG TPA: hypothetical protein VFR07_13820 [Mycobacteriales bacterium]|jgi:hypothetical protein|nr:hypothetical protein [Mycobacteriales bacterium]
MTAPDPTCPHCSAPITGAPACPRCRLRLTGTDAGRLWQVDQQLGVLMAERRELIARLLPAGAVPGGSRRSAQDVLLGTGGAALALAALVFAAWTYGVLEPAGRCAALVALALGAVAASRVALHRGLRSSAECAAAVALVLGVTALAPARAAGLLGADGMRPETWWALGTAGVAVLAGLVAWLVPTRAGRIGTVLLAHVSVLCLLARGSGDPETVAPVLAAVALLDVALGRLPLRSAAGAHLRRVLLVSSAVVAVPALLGALAADEAGAPLGATTAYGLLAVAALLASAARPGALVPAWLLGAAAAQALVGPSLGAGGRALTVGAVALAAVLVAERLADGQHAATRRAGYALLAKTALLAAPADEVAPGALAALGLLVAGLAAARLTRGSAAPALPAALAVLLTGVAAAALDLPAGDARPLVLGAVGLCAVAGSTVLPWATGRGSAAAGSAVALAGLWLGLGQHGVELVEAYTVPPALALLAAGALRHRRGPELDSVTAYGAGLSVLLVPSLLVAANDPADSVGRLLALTLLAAAVLLLGASLRLRALVVAGSAGVLAGGLLLLAPYADAVPRWVVLGAVGVLLTGVGATYEARRRDLGRARSALGTLR